MDRFVARPDPARRIILLHGSDEGMVAERASAIARAILGDGDDLNRIALDSAAIAADPGVLADEANAVSMFGGTRLVTVRVEGNRPIQKSVAAVLDTPPTDGWVVLQAGDLRRGTGLRGLVEKHANGAAIACYADEERGIDLLIDAEMEKAGLEIADDARAALRQLLGIDRGISRSELAKLALYADGRDRIDLADIEAVIGDGAAFAVDEAVDAAALGDTATLDRTLQRLWHAGTSPAAVAGAAQRHFDFLHRARAAHDGGAGIDMIVGRARPPVFFRRQPAVKRQIALWPRPRIARSLEILDAAVLATRVQRDLEGPIVSDALMRIALAASAANRVRG